MNERVIICVKIPPKKLGTAGKLCCNNKKQICKLIKHCLIIHCYSEAGCVLRSTLNLQGSAESDFASRVERNRFRGTLLQD